MILAEAYEKLQIVQKFLPVGSSNRPGTAIVPTYITIHNTDNAEKGADALMHAKYLQGAEARQRQVSWHYTVDDQRVVEHLHNTEMGWHAGTHAGNRQSIGIEVCENQGIDENAAINRASLLAAVLLHVLNIPPARIVPHQFWSGKHCPHVILDRYPGGMAQFIEQTSAYLAQLQAPAPAAQPGGDVWQRLIRSYAFANIAFPLLKPITLAQWMLASNRGTSRLATEDGNFAALQWRPEMDVYAARAANGQGEEREDYCQFASREAFILGFWHFLDREPYRDWQAHIDPPQAFLKFLVSAGYDTSAGYTERVLALLPEATALLSQATP